MRVSIITRDKTVVVNGIAISGISMDTLPSNVHAIQWYGDVGEVEIADPQSGKMVGNEPVSSVSYFQSVLDIWNTKKAEIDAAAAEAAIDDYIIQEI